jgi:hypothetical protein
MGRKPPVNVTREIVENDGRKARRHPPGELSYALGERIHQSAFGTLIKPGHAWYFLVGRD